MLRLKRKPLSTTFLPLTVGMGVVLAAGTWSDLSAQSQNPCAAKKPVAGKAAYSPCAAGAAAPCNPCAAGNPCAAKNPCAAAANPCNPCAAAATGSSADCEVPRLVQEAAANPCAAKNPCAAAASPCNPCNPCAPGEAVELTPAEASAAYECIQDAMQAAYTGGLQEAAASPGNPCAAANPCNPCAAKNPCAANPCAAANPCNPCAAAKPADPCSPCAAQNPCNPCAAQNPCKPEAAAHPCNPEAVQPAAVPDEVAEIARSYQGWAQVNTAPYVSATHGSRYVNNYPGPDALDDYLQYEEVGTMPAGARIAKDSFTVSPAGQVAVGPLFMMEKMPQGFNAASDDWRYAMIMPDGSLFGVTGGQGSEKVQFCAECHATVADNQDSLFFLPEEFRTTSR